MSNAISRSAPLPVPPRISQLVPPPPSDEAHEAQVMTGVEDAAIEARDLLRQSDTAAADVSALSRGLASDAVGRMVAPSATAPSSGEAAGEGAATGTISRAAALAAMQSGMLCGALDGLVMLTAHQALPKASLPVPAGLEGKRDLLVAGMEKAQEVAQGEWATMPTDDLQLLAGYGKHQNLHTGDEAQALAGHSSTEQTEWLMATFKAGYAIGMADAAIIARGENPDPVA